ncbi:hypothetical protein [uncultured Clostridium sp.]|uniref:hypothetical protein n=1 Tax=uncultured Clostridium sp. TaxID=59620 RepID=UPI00260CD031|nr:hypothetical protein [uncultured Clostridium sp.]
MLVFNETDKFKKLLAEFKEVPSLIELTLTDFHSLSNSIIESDKNFNYVYGIKDSCILLGAMAHRLDTYCPIPLKKRLYKNTFKSKGFNPPPQIQNLNDSYYIQVYLSKEKLYIYELDNCARVLNAHIILINKIKRIIDSKDYLTIESITAHSTGFISFNIVKSDTNTKTLDTLLKFLDKTSKILVKDF